MAINSINKNTTLGSLTTASTQDSKEAAAAGDTDKGGRAASRAGEQRNFDVSISAGAKARAEATSKATEIARNTSDIRADRVAALKAKIEAGQYEVSPEKIADGMAREAIRDHLALQD